MFDILLKLNVIAMAIHADSWKQTLPVMLIGMVGIFLVIGAIILITYGLNKLSAKIRKTIRKINNYLKLSHNGRKLAAHFAKKNVI